MAVVFAPSLVFRGVVKGRLLHKGQKREGSAPKIAVIGVTLAVLRYLDARRGERIVGVMVTLQR